MSKHEIQLSLQCPIVEIEKVICLLKNLLNYKTLAMNTNYINSIIFQFRHSLDTNSKLCFYDIRKRGFKISDKWQIIEYD